jgi:hypothetical protein
MKFYTGIGSRQTPIDIQKLMTRVAKALSNDSWILRSGGAEGADSAFEEGAIYKKIYLPWSGFSNKTADGLHYIVPPLNLDVVFDYHPAPERLSQAGLKLMSRNAYQVLGDVLLTPSEFVACWTSDGKASGGTGQALRIAKANGIPIYNFYNPHNVARLCTDFKIILD